jgi:type I restriction enzyme S subunit
MNVPRLRFKDDDGLDFPEWEIKKLEDFLILEFREVEKPRELYLAIGIRIHCKGTFQKPEANPEKNAMDNLFQVKESDLIVNITFAWEGAIAIVKKEDNNGLVSHRFPTYVFKEEVTNATFFQYIFIQPRFREKLELISPGGAGRNRVMSKKGFLKIKCEIPTVPEQTKIANFLTALDDKISHNQTQLHAVRHYKQGLLQQLFV